MNKPLFPKPQTLWTSLTGHDVVIQSCCNTTPTLAGEEQEPLVIYTDHLGHARSCPLAQWEEKFQPSRTQDTINSVALTSWQMATQHIAQSLDRLHDNQDINIDDRDYKTLLDMLKNARLEGFRTLTTGGITSGLPAPLHHAAFRPYVNELICTYDATLRATPVSGVPFACEIYERLGSPAESDFVIALVDAYIKLCARIEGRPIEDYVNLAAEIIHQAIGQSLP